MAELTENDWLQVLGRLDSCAVSDALDAHGIEGVALGLHGLTVPQRIVGFAMTVELGDDDGAASKRHLGTAAVAASGPDNVIVVAHNGRADVAGWGGILSLGASLKGVAGVVVDGGSRDVDEAREFGLPLYAKGPVCRTARGRIVEKNWNCPVAIAGVSVAPGDLVIADGSGVVFVPRDRAAEVLAMAEKIARREQLMAAALRDGAAITEVMGRNYEDMLKDSR